MGDCPDFFLIVGEATPRFVSDVGRSFSVADDLAGLFNIDSPVVGSDDQSKAHFGGEANYFDEGGVFKPVESKGSEGFIISDELVYNMIIGLRVGEDIDEIIDDGEEFVVFVLIKVLVDFSFKVGIEDFDVF